MGLRGGVTGRGATAPPAGGARVLTHRGGRSVAQGPSAPRTMVPDGAGAAQDTASRPATYARAVVRNPFRLAALARTRLRPGLGGGDGSRSSGRSSPGSRCRSSRSSRSAPGRSRSRSCGASTCRRRSGRARRRRLGRPVAPPPGAHLGGSRPGRSCSASIPVAFAVGVLRLAAHRGRGPGRGPDDVLRRRRQRLSADDRRARAAGRGEQRPGGERVRRRVLGVRHQRGPRPAPDRARSRSSSTSVSFLVSAVLLFASIDGRSAAAAGRGPRAGTARDPRGHPARAPRSDPAPFAGAQMPLSTPVGHLRGDLVPLRHRGADAEPGR